LLGAIPDNLLEIGSYTLTKDIGLLLFFAVIMIIAAISMINQRKIVDPVYDEKQHFNYPMIIAEGLVIGTLTGLVGAGGGFLIIPALVVCKIADENGSRNIAFDNCDKIIGRFFRRYSNRPTHRLVIYAAFFGSNHFGHTYWDLVK